MKDEKFTLGESAVVFALSAVTIALATAITAPVLFLVGVDAGDGVELVLRIPSPASCFFLDDGRLRGVCWDFHFIRPDAER